MRAFVVFVALAACTPSWTAKDTVLEAAWIATIAIDRHQTMTITGNCNESNPVMGPCGAGLPPAIYFPITLALHAIVSRALPQPWRLLFQAFTLGLEVSTIWGNAQSGVSAWPREVR